MEALVHRPGKLDPRRLDPSPTGTALAVATIVIVTLLLYGSPPPRLSEELYLPLVRHTGNAAYLAGDWTLHGHFSEHWVFDHAFGWLAAALPLPVFAWTGRIVSWTVLAWSLLRLGLRLNTSTAATTAGVALWLFANQAFIGGDWMFGTFEAKTVGYCLLVGALLAATNRRVGWSMALLGATVSLHPGVGIWAGIGLGITLVALPETRRAALTWAPVGAVVALPGVVSALSVGGLQSPDLTRFLVVEAIPQHADPFFGGARLAGAQITLHVLAVAGMLFANWWWMRHAHPVSRFAHRVLFGVQAVTMVAVAAAFVARPLHWWSFLLLAPMRVGPLLVALVFFVNLARHIQQLRAAERHRDPEAQPARSVWWRGSIAMTAGGVALALFASAPLLAGPRMMERTAKAWTTENGDAEAFAWIRTHTPRHTRCLVPVDRQDAFMLAERPIVANWQAIRYDDVREWRRRVTQMVGGPKYFSDPQAPGRIAGRRGGDLESLRHAYDALSRSALVRIAQRYHATCVVTTTKYDLPQWHRIGDDRVYRVGPGVTP